MSLLDDFESEYVMLEKKRVPDGEGGWYTTWEDGAAFNNYRAHDSSLQARIAEQDGMRSTYTFLVNKNVPIEFHDYFFERSTSDTYYVTSDPQDHIAPRSSTFELKYFTAEKRALPEVAR